MTRETWDIQAQEIHSLRVRIRELEEEVRKHEAQRVLVKVGLAQMKLMALHEIRDAYRRGIKRGKEEGGEPMGEGLPVKLNTVSPDMPRLKTSPADAGLPVQEKVPAEADGRWETVCCDCGLIHAWQIIPCGDGGYFLTVWRRNGI